MSETNPRSMITQTAEKYKTKFAPQAEAVQKQLNPDNDPDVNEVAKFHVDDMLQREASTPAAQRGAGIQQKLAELGEKRAKNGELSKGETIAFTLASSLPQLLAGVFGGDERTAAQGGNQILQSAVALKAQQNDRYDQQEENLLKQQQTIQKAESDKLKTDSLSAYRQDKLAQTDRNSAADRALRLKIAELNARTKQTPEQKQKDKVYVENLKAFNPRWTEFQKSGGLRESVASNKELNSIISELETVAKKQSDAESQYKGSLPRNVQTLINNDIASIRLRVERIGQRNLKSFFPGAISEKEAEGYFNRLLQESLKPAQNLASIQRLKEEQNNMLMSIVEDGLRFEKITEGDLKQVGLLSNSPKTETSTMSREDKIKWLRANAPDKLKGQGYK